MRGVSATTGKALAGRDHLAQSIGDILSTPVGARICRRDYGSMLFELTDQPMNGLGRQRLFAATASALARWEPRLRLTRVSLGDLSGAVDGVFSLLLEGTSTEEPAPNQLIRLTIPLDMRIFA